MPIVAKEVLRMVADVIGIGDPPTEVCRESQRLAGALIRLLQQAEFGSIEYDEEEDIEWTPELEDEEGYVLDASSADDDMDDDDDKVKFDNKLVSYEAVQKAYDFYRGSAKGSRSLSCMTASYRFIRTKNHLQILRMFGEGQSKEALVYRQRKLGNAVRDETFRLFAEGMRVSDMDLKRIALEINAKEGLLPSFSASSSWVNNFKTTYGISSRRITTFISRKAFDAKPAIEQLSRDFVASVVNVCNSNPGFVLANMDQTGVLKELHSARTLAPIGIKRVEVVTQSKASLTHSYSCMPILYSNGKLGKKLFVQLQEPKGSFPAIGHFQCDNLFIVPGKSHIMNKATMIEFFQNCLLTSSEPDNIIVLVDSWSSFKDEATIQSLVPLSKSLKLFNIPPGTTGMIQPADVGFFSYFKGFLKSVHSYVFLKRLDFPIAKRDNIIKVLSLSYKQFCSVRFEALIAHAFYASGYIANHLPPYLTPVKYCFDKSVSTHSCDYPCPSTSFIRCSDCEKFYCFHHFVVCYHYC